MKNHTGLFSMLGHHNRHTLLLNIPDKIKDIILYDVKFNSIKAQVTILKV